MLCFDECHHSRVYRNFAYSSNNTPQTNTTHLGKTLKGSKQYQVPGMAPAKASAPLFAQLAKEVESNGQGLASKIKVVPLYAGFAGEVMQTTGC